MRAPIAGERSHAPCVRALAQSRSCVQSVSDNGVFVSYEKDVYDGACQQCKRV